MYFDSTLDWGKSAFLLPIPEIRGGEGRSKTEFPSGRLETVLRIPRKVERPQWNKHSHTFLMAEYVSLTPLESTLLIYTQVLKFDLAFSNLKAYFEKKIFICLTLGCTGWSSNLYILNFTMEISILNVIHNSYFSNCSRSPTNVKNNFGIKIKILEICSCEFQKYLK